MSTRCQEHIDIEIDKGNRLQASEKIWTLVAHALKAVAEQRGWEHDSHSKLAYVARRLETESAKASFRTRRVREQRATAFVNHYTIAESMHSNFYENGCDWTDIEAAQADAQEFIAKLDTFWDKPLGSFTIRTNADQRRIARLLGIDMGRRTDEREEVLVRMLPVRTSGPKSL